MKLVAKIAELALESDSAHTFHERLLELLTAAIGAVGGGILLQSGNGMRSDAAFNMGGSQDFAASMASYAQDFNDAELAHILASGTVRTDEMFSSKRQNELEMFRYLKSIGGDRNVFRAWVAPGRVHFYGLAQACGTSFAKFAPRAIRILDDVFPVVALGAKLHANGAAQDEDALPRALTLEFRLTAAEHKTVALVLRGLTNGEIGAALGISINTVRNRLAACFTKVGVSRRAELVFVLTDARREQTLVRRPSVTMFKSVLQAELARIERRIR
jgi:DNA-binding CsgD family transcriptional regulator